MKELHVVTTNIKIKLFIEKGGNHLKTELMKIQPRVEEVAEAISAVLGVDVEIVDTDLIRVAVTGRLSNRKGKKLFTYGHMYRRALNSLKSYVIYSPGKEELCTKCEWYGKCIYEMAVYSPIKFQNEAVGVMSLTAFNAKQKEILSENIEGYLNFVGKMAILIGSMVKEQHMLEQVMVMANRLEEVINSVEEAIIAIDEKGIITHFNVSAKEKLKLKNEYIYNTSIKEIIPNYPIMDVLGNGKFFDYPQEINTSMSNIKFLVTTRPIIVNKNIVGAVILLKELGQVQNFAYSLINDQNLVYFRDIIGESTIIKNVKAIAERIALSDSTVLLVGETGTGKELFARAIHSASLRSCKPFIVVNCSAMPETLIESELFGYEKGAFTGARNIGKPGKFELAHGGTIFLDEIEAMPLYLQPKLLRVIEQKEVERLGGTKPLPIDVRIIAASNEKLEELVEEGRIRADLYHRLNVVPITIPPLRERENDVMILARYFLDKFSKLMKRNIYGFQDEVIDILINYSWPGNVRELQNAIEYAVNIEQSWYISTQNLPHHIRQFKEKSRAKTLEELEKEAIINALNQCSGFKDSKAEAAKLLGISRSTIYRKLRKYNIDT